MIQTSSYWQQLLASVLAEKIGSGGFTGPLNGLTLFLFSNQLLLSPQTAFGDLTESTWSGYALRQPRMGGAHPSTRWHVYHPFRARHVLGIRG